jgi:hypothetical protein
MKSIVTRCASTAVLAGLSGVAQADIALSSQSASVSVQGFVVTPTFPAGGYNHGPSNSLLLAPINLSDADSAFSGGSTVASDMGSVIDGTAYGTTGLLVTGAAAGHASSFSNGASNTTPGAFQNYQLAFTLDTPTAVYLRVTILQSSPVTSGSIGLLSNPNSIGWGAGPGTYEFNDVLAPGAYTLNMNTGIFYSTGGTTESYGSDANFRFELGVVPTPGSAGVIGVCALSALRRRR